MVCVCEIVGSEDVSASQHENSPVYSDRLALTNFCVFIWQMQRSHQSSSLSCTSWLKGLQGGATASMLPDWLTSQILSYTQQHAKPGSWRARSMAGGTAQPGPTSPQDAEAVPDGGASFCLMTLFFHHHRSTRLECPKEGCREHTTCFKRKIPKFLCKCYCYRFKTQFQVKDQSR